MTVMIDKHEKLVRAKTLADELDIPVGWIISQAEQGQIPSIKTGKIRLFNYNVVVANLRFRATFENFPMQSQITERANHG